MKIVISRCNRTGLLYVNEVPFTVERINMVMEVMSYANGNNNQFEHSIIIRDTEHDNEIDGMVIIDKTNYQDFLDGVD